MPRSKWFYCVCFYALVSLVPAAPALAQLTSTPKTVALSANLAESLTVTITTPGPVNFTLTGSTADLGSVAPAWTTTGNLKPSRTSMAVCVYLTGALSGSAGNSDTILPANVLAQPDSSGGFLALTGSACGQTNAVTIKTTALTAANRTGFSQSDSVALEINDSGLTLEADTYTGTLNIVAQATP